MRASYRLPGLAGGFFFAALAVTATPASANVPECMTRFALPLPEAGANPTIEVWQGDELEAGLSSLACEVWDDINVDLVGATAARIGADATLEDIMQRIGDVDAYQQIQFWSFERSQWEPLFDETRPLSGPSVDDTGSNFGPEAFATGSEFYMFLDESDRVSGMVQKATILAKDDDRLVFATENVTPGKIWVVQAIAPGGSGGMVSITRNGEGSWDYYAVTRVAYAGSGLFDIPAKAFSNRATGLFRYTAGIPTDEEPPSAP